MSFGTLETSIDSSIPIELYEFSYQGTLMTYTSADTNITIGANTYVSMPISRSELVESPDIGKNNLTLICPDAFPVSALFVTGPPSAIVTVTIKRVQQGALDTGDVVVIWVGRITTVNFPPLRSEITCESVFTSLRVAGIHRIYSMNCVFALYGSECKADQGSYLYQTPTNCTQVGNVLYGAPFAAYPTGYFAGGIVTWQPVVGYAVTRGIKSHQGTGTGTPSVEITYEIPNFPVGGDVLTLYPGCDHSMATCISKFNNLVNYGGFPYMTQKNPWANVSVF